MAIGYLVALSLGLFAVAIPLDLLMRRVGLGNMPWLYELIEYVLYAGVFLATPWVLREGAHVRVDIVVSALPRAQAVWLERLLDLIGAAISGVLLYYGWRAAIEAYVGDSRQFKTLIIFDWWLMTIFCVAALLLMIEFLLRMRRAGAVLDADEDATAKAGF
jgi:TRAP-type C4-dicarboxylate transport system permease small subunit